MTFAVVAPGCWYIKSMRGRNVSWTRRLSDAKRFDSETSVLIAYAFDLMIIRCQP